MFGCPAWSSNRLDQNFIFLRIRLYLTSYGSIYTDTKIKDIYGSRRIQESFITVRKTLIVEIGS